MNDYKLIGGTAVSVMACSLWFIATALFARFNSPEYTKQEEEFFKRLHTPIVADPGQTRSIDLAQVRTLSRLCIPYGGFVMLLAAIPNPLEGRLSFIVSGGLIVGIGLLLRWRAAALVRQEPPAQAAPVAQR
ncbi:MAG TPA: hypothetical protein VMI53_06355 [Opitutaceae bacterium]|nr:hypothetical protein [Opitutaceae bacterium]